MAENKKAEESQMPNKRELCKATTRKGTPCQKTPMKDSVYCFLHCGDRFHWIHLLKSPILNILSVILTIVALVWGYIQNVESKDLIEYNRGLLENLVTNKYEKDLQSKYPGGYALFGIDHSRAFENRSIPHRSNVLEEYEFDWRPVKISEVTETNVTIEFPDIHYKPLNSNLLSTAMIIPKSPKGEPYRYPPRPKGSKNIIFCELVEYKDSFYVFAIGFKPADN
jgi:hypothetical protein